MDLETLVLARVVETCSACPSQWDAWTVDGQYLYLRYRFGRGTVDTYRDPNPDTWTDTPPLVEFGEKSMDGCMLLEDFLEAAGLELAPDAVVVPFSLTPSEDDQ